ncbi:hypothetical protein [Sorangium sp. So ce385]|uniref:hypothetical protein n=1 Tax=Sorangium sp. So ce385 TaxID=3133308 RepID=UPI003F5C724C
MHNLDRTTLEMEHELEGHELEGEGELEAHELEQEGFLFEGEGEGLELEGEGEGEGEGFEFEGELEAHELEGELEAHEASPPFHEAETMELAAELLSVSNEQELNQFLGGLIKKAAGAARSFARSSVGKSVLGGLRQVARRALPMVGSALGNMVMPGVGGVAGGKLASMAGRMFGLELEGLSAEDREFEIAKQFVNLAGAATRNAARLARAGTCAQAAPPPAVARRALLTAARRYAPGLVPQLVRTRTAAGGSRQVLGREVARGVAGRAVPRATAGRVAFVGGVAGATSGRWFRRGNTIVLVGI